MSPSFFHKNNDICLNISARIHRPNTYALCLLSSLNSLYNSTRYESAVLADFNIDYNQIHDPNSPAKRLDDIASVFGLSQTIKLPTRITDASATCIDLLFTNVTDYKAGAAIVSVADHLLNYIAIGKQKSNNHHRFVTSRNFKNMNEDNLRADLQYVPWHVIESFTDINDAWHAWKCLFTDVVNSHAQISSPEETQGPMV
jgi:hypothetical protein